MRKTPGISQLDVWVGLQIKQYFNQKISATKTLLQLIDLESIEEFLTARRSLGCKVNFLNVVNEFCVLKNAILGFNSFILLMEDPTSVMH